MTTGSLVFTLLALALLAGVVLTVPALTGAFDSRRWVQLDLALVLAAATGLLVLYSRQDDGYYSAGVSRWEHATRAVGSGSVSVMLALGVAATAGILAVSFLAGRWRRVGVPLALLASVALLLAWFSMTGGH